MARRAQFGQLPRSAPSLTSTIVAAAREMQARRDQNIMDAWRNGGTFEGAPATDERVLAYWRARLKSVDKDDPLADTYRQAIYQYEYAIAESKMTVKYAQGKIGNGAMAQFYLGWAKKVPRNTEFYRVLQRDAAQFMRAAKSGNAASAARAREQAYQNSQEATAARYEKVGQYLTDTFVALAQANALIGLGNNEDLTDFDPSDPASMNRLMRAINGADRSAGRLGGAEGVAHETSVLYHDPLTGKPVTGDDILAKIKSLDPNFSGAMTPEYYANMLRRQLQGQQIRYERATKTGHATDAKNIQGWMQYTGEVARESNIWPVQESYMNARSLFLTTWLDPLATPDSKVAAWKAYAGSLSALANDQKNPVDDATRARLMAEVQGNDKVSSLAEDFTGLGSPDHTTTGLTGQGDIAETHFDLQRYTEMKEGVRAGQLVWALGETKNGVFIPTPGGREIGAAAPQDVLAASPASAVPVVVPQAGADPITVWAPGIPVTATAHDANGVTLKSFAQAGGSTANTQIGTAYDITVNGQTTRIYSYQSSGKTYYTADAPWGSGVVSVDTPSGITLDVSAYIPTDLTDVDTSSQTGLFYVDPTDGSNKLTFNPTALVFATDPERVAAGPDPLTDSFSPTLAAILGTSDASNTLYTLGKDPNFRNQIDMEARTAAGFTLDVNGAWVGGDQAAYDKFSRQSGLMMTIPDLPNQIGGLIGAVSSLFQRDTTEPTFAGAVAPNSSGSPDDRAELGFAGKQQLPSDQVRGTGFDALAQAFEAGKSIIDRITGAGTGTAPLTIKTEGQIKVPEAPTITAGPSSITAAVKIDPVKTAGTIQKAVTTSVAPSFGTAPTAGDASPDYIQRRTGGY